MCAAATAHTASVMQNLQEDLSSYFIAEQLGKGTHVIKFDFEQEIWFLIRYPGQLKRQMEIDPDGEPNSRTFKPEEYDAVVYHKHYGALRMNTNRVRDRTKCSALERHVHQRRQYTRKMTRKYPYNP